MPAPIRSVRCRGGCAQRRRGRPVERQRWTNQIAPVVEFLGDRSDELAARQMTAVRSTLPSYRSARTVPDDTIMAMGRANVERVMSTLRLEAAPKPEDVS